jgi:hypothetical protein
MARSRLDKRAAHLPHRGAVGDQAVVAAVVRRYRDRDHLALELAQARRRQHQVVVHGDEGRELGHVKTIGLEHIGDEVELFLAFGEIGRHLGRQRCRLQRQRRDLGIVAGRGAGARLRLGFACFAALLGHMYPL